MAVYRRPGVRARRRLAHRFCWAGGLLALALILTIALSRRGASGDPVAAPPSPPPATQVPAAQPTPAPTTAATASPAAEFQALSARAQHRIVAPTPEQEGYLPIYDKAATNEKIIAVTVDDFYQFDNARTIIDLALSYGCKLTLFPIGKNVLREELHDTLVYAYENGMEFENHTFEHRPLYKMDDAAMARQIYLQCLSIDYVLGVDYQEHFFRPGGGDGRDDQRTHLYLKQIGMAGVAHWSVSGSDTKIDRLLDTIEPGNVYLFHTTDADTEKLQTFIPAAVEAGYQLVTLNELFNLPENEVRPLTDEINIHNIPQIAPYTLAPRTYVRGDYQWTAFCIQRRLGELGYLACEPDGIYGDSTFKAVGAFQRESGLPETGNADPATQEALFSQNAAIQ